MVSSEPGLLLWAMSGFIAQQQSGSGLMSVAPVATRGCPESGQPAETMLVSRGIAAIRAILTWVTYAASGAMGISRPSCC